VVVLDQLETVTVQVTLVLLTIFQLLQLAGPVKTVQVVGLLLPVKELAAVPGLVLVLRELLVVLVGPIGTDMVVETWGLWLTLMNYWRTKPMYCFQGEWLKTTSKLKF
jgi:predicted ABC-type exoprotein transport system permease subunit